MKSAGAGRIALIVTGMALLAGCEEGKEFKLFDKPLFSRNQSAEEGAASAPLNATTTIEKDVEAPEVFQKTENGLWDGRPSLGGVWVAHPDVVDPERAIIRNEDNGKFIIGALFRRERENPGPRFQVSSDAAAELGMLAGAPAKLNVTVLRRVEVPVEPPVAEPAVDTLEPAEEIAQEPLDDVAQIAASAIEAATEQSGSEAAGAEAEAEAQAPAPAPVPAQAAKLEKPFIQIGIFSVKENADNTANLLRNSGVLPTIKEFNSNGKTYWRVVVGPVGNAADRKALLSKVSGLGFSDAYPVTN